MSTGRAGDLIRLWRKRRRISQLGLALEANVSARHLSFVESGRSLASRDLLQRLGETLNMPLRDRNLLLVAGGYAPVHSTWALGDPDMQAASAAIRTVLDAHDPFPALALDRYWTLLAANRAAQRLMQGMPERLTRPPMNVLRLSLDPEGLAPRIVNLAEWRHHLLERLRADAAATADPELARLHDEIAAFPAPITQKTPAPIPQVAVPLMLAGHDGFVMSLLSATTVFGTANDVTLSEITLESFFPADEATRAYLLTLGARAESDKKK